MSRHNRVYVFSSHYEKFSKKHLIEEIPTAYYIFFDALTEDNYSIRVGNGEVAISFDFDVNSDSFHDDFTNMILEVIQVYCETDKFVRVYYKDTGEEAIKMWVPDNMPEYAPYPEDGDFGGE